MRTAHARGVASLLREALAGQVRVFETEIRTQVALKDSIQEGRTILDFRGDSQAAQAYRELADDLVQALALDVSGGDSSEPIDEIGSSSAEWLPEPPVELRRRELDPVGALAHPGQPEREPAALSRFASFLNGHDEWLGQQRVGR